ncbi:tigger transposable element-derived protein 6 [Trichonephila clavipes]|nr:tigger transposable element-derived protein 6 [Trichonephila clavipes]
MQHEDPVLSPIIQKIDENDVGPQVSNYLINGEGLLCHLSKRPSRSPRSNTTRKQVCIPHCLKARILESVHSEYGRHLKFFKTYHRLSENFFWQNMYKDTKNFVRSFTVCLSRKTAFKIPPAPHQPVEQSQEPGETCHINIFGPLKTTRKASASSGPSGIKRKALSISDKLNILKKYDEGCKANKKQKEIAEELGIAPSTIRTVLKSRVDIEKNVGGTKRQKLKHAKHEDLEKVLVEWFQQKKARSNNYPLSGGVIMEKAKEIASHLNITDFCGSTGWLDRFRNRHGIVYRQISGEAEAVNEDDISSWKNNVLPSLLQDYAPEDVYNADEFGLFFKLMPDKSFVFKNETCHGGKLSKERLTVLACTNATGTHKIKLVVIGKSRSPRCFKNVRSLPCDYLSQALDLG